MFVPDLRIITNLLKGFTELAYKLARQGVVGGRTVEVEHSDTYAKRK